MNFRTNSGKIFLAGIILACLSGGWILSVRQQVSQSNSETQLSFQDGDGFSLTGVLGLGQLKAKLPPLKDIGGDFTLTGHQGDAISLRDYRGKVVLLFFGYTNCPDACPLALSEMKQIMHLLGEHATQVQPLFITFDPERDTPEHLQTYLAYFHPKILGLTGSPEAIAQVAKQYQVLYVKQEAESAAGYLFAHSTYLYLIDQQGQVRQRYRSGSTPVEQMVEDIQYLLTASNA